MESTGAGRRFVITAIVVLVIVLALDAAFYFVMPSLESARPPTITPGPSPTPVPSDTPVPTPTEIPCEPVVWWDTNQDTIEAFFVSDVMQGDIESAEDYAELVNDQQALRDEVAALPYPPCLAQARDSLLAAMDAFIGAFNAPDAETILTADDLAGLPPESVRQLYSLTADSYDNLVLFITALEEQDVDFDNADLGGEVRIARDYAEVNTAECMATRWVFTEVIPWLALSGTYAQAVSENPPDREVLRRLLFSLQNEGQNVEREEFPDCMEDARAHLLDANDALVLVIQGILAGDSAQSGENLPIYSQALNNLQRSIRSSTDFLSN